MAKRWEKQLPINTTFRPPLELIDLILDEDSVKGLRVTKIVKEKNLSSVSQNQKEVFRDIIVIIFENNSNFHVKQRSTGKD